MGLMEILAWIVFGGLAGWVASLIMGQDSKLGILGNIIVGIVGSFIGGLILPNDGDRFDFGSFVAAVLGAVILLFVVNLITRGRQPRI